MPPPVDDIGAVCSPAELAVVARIFVYAQVGNRETVKAGLADFLKRTSSDELMITNHIYDHAARLRSFQIAAEVRGALEEADRAPAA